MIIILAGTQREYEHYLHENGLTRNDAIYARDARSIRGIQADKIVEIGTYYKRPDYWELIKEAKERLR